MIFPEIVSQHAEGAADLWSLRDALVRGPEVTLRDLGRLDERIEAHLDGLRIAGYEAREVCDEILPGASGGEVFARFLWAFSAGAEAQIHAVISASERSLDAARGLSSALGWLRFQDAESPMSPAGPTQHCYDVPELQPQLRTADILVPPCEKEYFRLILNYVCVLCGLWVRSEH